MAGSLRRHFARTWLVLTSLWVLAIVLLALLRYPAQPFTGLEAPALLTGAILLVGVPAVSLALGLSLIWVAEGFRPGKRQIEPPVLMLGPDAAEEARRLAIEHRPLAVEGPASGERPVDGMELTLDAASLGLLRRHPDLLDPELREAALTGGNAAAELCDLVAEDRSGNLVLIAFETDTAGLASVARILAAMGAVAEGGSRPVRGILVARDFHPATRHAAQAAPGLALRRYRLSVMFEKA